MPRTPTIRNSRRENSPIGQQRSLRQPFETEVFHDFDNAGDAWPASYHRYNFDESGKRRVVSDPSEAVLDFLHTELSLGSLDEMLKHLWFAGARHPASQLHLHVAMGREVVVVDRIDLHLLWDEGRIFLKPIPRFLLNPRFWLDELKCPDGCSGDGHGVAGHRIGVWPHNRQERPCMENLHKVAYGFLYTYACLVSSETDFIVANEKRLLPRNAKDLTIEWARWKSLVRELLRSYDEKLIHPRFLRAELRLTRLNSIHRFTRFPPFDPYLRGWRNYSSLFRDNLAWMATVTVFIALLLTAMQVGLATERLQGNVAFQRASYGLTIFALLGPICAFCLVVLAALLNLMKDLPWLLRDHTVQQQRDQTRRRTSVSVLGTPSDLTSRVQGDVILTQENPQGIV